TAMGVRPPVPGVSDRDYTRLRRGSGSAAISRGIQASRRDARGRGFDVRGCRATRWIADRAAVRRSNAAAPGRTAGPEETRRARPRRARCAACRCAMCGDCATGTWPALAAYALIANEDEAAISCIWRWIGRSMVLCAQAVGLAPLPLAAGRVIVTCEPSPNVMVVVVEPSGLVTVSFWSIPNGSLDGLDANRSFALPPVSADAPS